MPQLFPKKSSINSVLSFPHAVSYLYKSCKKIFSSRLASFCQICLKTANKQKLLMNKRVTKKPLFPLEIMKPFFR